MKKLILFLKSIYYYLLNLYTLKKGKRVYINKFPFRLPVRYYKFFRQDYEQENFTFFKEVCKPNMNIIDIGAHFGLFTVYMQRLSSGKVYSFEPTPSTLSVLKETVKLNNVQNHVEIVPAAVSDRNGKAKFYIDKVPGAVANSLIQYGEKKNYTFEHEVDVVALDDFIAKKNIRIDFIKIDAEGAEYSVLKGAIGILSSHRPVIILGMHPEALAGRNENNEMIWDLVAGQQYKILLDDHLVSKEEFCSKTGLFDVYLIPGESFFVKQSTVGC